MKVLILNGSPRMKGNTKAALSAVADGIREGLKPEELEIYDVSKHKLSACLACDGCKRNGGTCVQPDDTAELIQKIMMPTFWYLELRFISGVCPRS